MKDINLILQERKPSQTAQKFSKTLYKFFTIFLTLFLVTSITSMAIIVLLSFKIKDLKTQKTRLETQITSLQKTEQKLVLIKDRIEKINEIRSQDKIKDQIVIFKDNLSLIQNPSKITGIKFSQTLPIISVFTDSSPNMTKYLNTLTDTGKYSDIEIVSLSFNPLKGYVMDLSFSK